MIIINSQGHKFINATREETYDWAHRPGNSWPCSGLSGSEVRIELDGDGNLVDLFTEASSGEIQAHELNAFIEDALADNLLERE